MKRTKYMQKILNETYPDIVVEAIKGGFDEAWERLIAERLLKDYNARISEAECLIHSVGGLSLQKRMQVAKLITSSSVEDRLSDCIGDDNNTSPDPDDLKDINI